MSLYSVAIVLLCIGASYCMTDCSHEDKVIKTWEGGRRGELQITANTNDTVTIVMSTAISRVDFFCLKLLSSEGVAFQYQVRQWCPSGDDGKRKITYALYYINNDDKVEITDVDVNGKMYCKEDVACSSWVHVDNDGPGFQDGTITVPVKKALTSWKLMVGFDRDVTGFNINEGQPDPDAKDPCPKIQSQKSYEYNKNIKAGTFKMKYYLSFIESQGVPKIVYVDLHDSANSNQCGTKPTCP